MSTITIVIQNAPYEPGNKAWHALRFAGAALTEDMDVQVHLLDDGVKVGQKNQDVPVDAANLEELIHELMEFGLQVRACGLSLDGCAIDEAALVDGIQRGSMKALAAWVKDSDQVMVF